MTNKVNLTSFFFVSVLLVGCRSPSESDLEGKDVRVTDYEKIAGYSSNKDVTSCMEKMSGMAIKFAERQGMKKCDWTYKDETMLLRNGTIVYRFDCNNGWPEVFYPTTYPRGCMENDKESPRLGKGKKSE